MSHETEPSDCPDPEWDDFLAHLTVWKEGVPRPGIELNRAVETPETLPHTVTKVAEPPAPPVGRVRPASKKDRAKSAWNRLHAGTVKTLDAGAKAVRPFTTKYYREADRRAELRTPETIDKRTDAEVKVAATRAMHALAQAAWKQAVTANGRFASASDVARINLRAASAKLKAAKAASKAAKAACPASLGALAVKGHLAQGCAGTVLALSQSSPWPLLASGAAAAAWYGALLLGRRTPAETAAPEADGMTREERELMRRLDTSWWVEHAERRGLGDTTPGKAAFGLTGPTVAVRLDGKWDLDAFKGAGPKVRTLLGVKKGTRMRISEGETSQWAVVTLLTRSALGEAEAWNPDKISSDEMRVSLGFDTESGEEVFLDFDQRTLFCGASGSGKSWSSRALLVHAHQYGDVCFVDPKLDEITDAWGDVVRCASEGDEVRDLIREVHGEMNYRKHARAKAKAAGRTLGFTQLTFFVDEGQVALALTTAVKSEAEELLQMLREIFSLGRARRVVGIWCTQKPTFSGKAPGLDTMIVANIDQRFSLRVANATESQTALDDCADYAPHTIPAKKSMRGHGYLRGHGATLIRTHTITNEDVQALTPKIWRASAASTGRATPADVEARKALEAAGDAPAEVAELSPADRVRAYRDAHPDASYGAIAKATGVPKASVIRYLK